MKWILMTLLSLFIVGCDGKKDEELEKQRKDKHDQMYKTPPPSDRSKNKGF